MRRRSSSVSVFLGVDCGLDEPADTGVDGGGIDIGADEYVGAENVDRLVNMLGH